MCIIKISISLLTLRVIDPEGAEDTVIPRTISKISKKIKLTRAGNENNYTN